MQHQISSAIAISFNPQARSLLDRIDVKIQRFPYPAFDNDLFMFALQFIFPLIMMLSFIYPVVNLTKNIVLEKELRLKEAMRMMGLQDWLHWVTWFINSLFWNMISIGIITTLFCIELPFNKHNSIIANSDPTLILLFFTLYSISSIMFCFFLSTLFSRANIAGVMAGAGFFVTFMPYFFVNMNYHQLDFIVKLAAGSIFNTNMAIGCILISMLETEHVGLQWSNLFEPATPDDNIAFFWILFMFVVDSIVYFFLAFYISNVFPGEFGTPKKWYFFFDISYWRDSVDYEDKHDNNNNNNNDLEMKTFDEENGKRHSLSAPVNIHNLSKSYDGGKSFSVKSFNLSMEQDEITVLLGHNGAGKTTLMSVLCGLIPPTSGLVNIHGHDLKQDIVKIRKHLGICPQFDVLFDYLTVEEHLWFFCKLKDIQDDIIDSEIDKMVTLLDLKDKRYKRADTLSGGMKRKLSVGIALVGGSKFVLLDEATSGMDVSARRFIWDLLIKEKQNRTILLSTHFMEEADVLGDKIAIMELGSLKCFGTPMQLKKNYGLGYLLTFGVNEERVNVRRITDLIRSYINNAKLLTSVGTEIIYSLPESETQKFEVLFKTIEQNLDNLGILNYGVSVTTIEEVFLRVGDFSKQATEQSNNFNGTLNAKEESSVIEKIKHNSMVLNQGFEHAKQIYRGLFAKKFLYMRRNMFLIVSQFLMPSILLLASILVNRSRMDKASSSPPIKLSLDLFKKIYATSFYEQNNEESVIFSNSYLNSVSMSHSVQHTDSFPIKWNESVQNISTEHLLDSSRQSEAEYNLYHLLAGIFEVTSSNITFTALFNNQAYHASAISLAYIDKILFKYLTNDNSSEISVWNDPMPRKNSDAFNAREFDSTLQIQLSNSIQFSLCFLLATFAILVVKENATNFKHIQKISGLSLFQYWVSNFIFDFVCYVLSCVMMSLVVYFASKSAFNSLTMLGYLIDVFIVNGLAALPFIYLMSLFFRDPATAYVGVSLYTLIAATSTFLLVLIMGIPDFDLLDTSHVLDTVFSLLLPVYTLAIAIVSLYRNDSGLKFCLSSYKLDENTTIGIQDLCKILEVNEQNKNMLACCKDKCGGWCMTWEQNYWGWEKPGIAQYILSSLVQCIVFWAILAAVESDFISLRSIFSFFKQNLKIEGDSITDDDVQAEVDRIKRRNSFTLNKSDSMTVQNVSKKYGTFMAVNDISFGVKRAQCFGILGVNGAGKTTTFKMITGAEKITNGDIVINGNNTKDGMSKIFKDIGYCPQFDGLLDQLTGRETLTIISRIRGITENVIDSQIDALSKLLYFEKHIDQTIDSYSGGTKRKLSFAIAIVGHPLITFLDEPTTGVDPVSRRCLWNAIQLVRSAGSSVVLTSHSMEECEALCNRLMIMVNARISCIGSPLHLKQKFGAGYIIQVKLKINSDQSRSGTTKLADDLKQRPEFESLNNYMISHLPSCQLESVHNNLLTYRIMSSEASLSTLFGEIENIKDKLLIEDYSINQTSLERIFLTFAKQRRNSYTRK